MVNYHILPRIKGWAVKKEGSKRASRIFARQGDATNFAKKLGGYAFVHGKDGSIRNVARPGKTTILTGDSFIESKQRVHVLPQDDLWAVKKENNSKPSKIFSRKYRAIREAHKIADNNNSAMVVHNLDGTINHVDIPPHFENRFADLIHLR